MYTLSAKYYDELFSFKSYADDVRRIRQWIAEYNLHAKSLLDVACGTGRHLELLQADFEIAGVDLNPEFLEIARNRCPKGDFREGDMADFDCGQRFDVVTCLFSSIGYTRTLERMQASIACMARHLNPGGLLLLEPWFTPQRYLKNYLKLNVSDTPERKIVWMYTTDVKDRLAWWDIHYLVGTAQEVNHFVEHHEVGLFTHEEYSDAITAASLKVEHDAYGLQDRGMYFGIKPR